MASKSDSEMLKEPGKKPIKIPKKVFQPSFRLNVTSDFEATVWEPFVRAFRNKAMFYDYSKLMQEPLKQENYHLTYSANGAVQVIDGKLVISKELRKKRWQPKITQLGQSSRKITRGRKGRKQTIECSNVIYFS